MKLWIRWSGIAGFLALSALIVVIWMFAIGPLIKYSIETFGSKAANAKVEVDSVSLSFNPLGLDIRGVQVANSDKPMENLFQFDRAVADIELLPLVLGKGIVNQAALTGVAFSTPRTTSGALPDSGSEMEKGFSSDDAKELVLENTPSADELLAREPLLTVERGNVFKESVVKIKAESEAAIEGLPTQEDLANYKQEFNALTTGKFDSIEDFQKRKKEFDALKSRIQKDQKAISTAQTVITSGKDDLQSQWDGLKSAPGEDFDNLSSKYQLNSSGAANLSGLLFGDKVGDLSQQALYWYTKISPFLTSETDNNEEPEEEAPSRLEGRIVHFKTDNPLPDMLIKKMQLAVYLPSEEGKELGDVDVQIYDITHQQNVINRPTRVIAEGNNLTNIKSLDFKGTLDHRTSPGKDAFDIALKGMQLENYDVGAMGLKLENSLVDLDAQAELSGDQIQATSRALFSQPLFSTKDKTLVAQEVTQALGKVRQFDINAGAKGDVIAPKIDLSSNLDKQLSNALAERLKEKQGELEVQLKEKLNDKLLAYAGDYKDQIASMDLANSSLGNAQSELKEMLTSELTSFADQQKAEAKEKLDEKRKEEEEKAKEAAKNKLKSLF